MRFELDRSLKILLMIILAAVVGYVGWQVVVRVLYPLELLLMGAIVAFILSPPVQWLHRHHIPRPLAILIVYIALLGVMSLLGYLLINPLVNQVSKLAAHLPQQLKNATLPSRVQDFNNWLNAQLTAHGIKKIDIQGKITDYVSSEVSTAGQNVAFWASNLVVTSFTFLVDTVLVLVVAFYLLLDGELLKERLYTLVPTKYLSQVVFVEATVSSVLGGYLRGQLLMSLTIGTMAGVGTYILGVDYPVLIGVLAGILELVPMLGPWLASMPAVVIALFNPHPWPLTVFVIIYFLIIQQLESNVIGPRITGRAVGLHPLGAMMALLVGIELDGILGALLAVPVAGILFVIATAIYYHLKGQEWQPEVQRKAYRPLLLGTFGNMRLRRGAEAGEPVRGRLAGGFRRVVPKRLANVEERRDAMLRPKLQARGVEQDEIEGARVPEALDLDPELEEQAMPVALPNGAHGNNGAEAGQPTPTPADPSAGVVSGRTEELVTSES
ncbi:MAG TPA: AI-2E family transporter [Chloroflexota bacterium]|nr:AI-2E family transporter [Chloroflexota bacterium]